MSTQKENKQTKQTEKRRRKNRQIKVAKEKATIFVKNLEVGKMKTRGRWQIK
jgi:hypothetical protein